jgi:phage terminase small subunit
VRQNPLVRIAAASADAMIRFAGEFGLTPVARARGSRLARLVSRPAAGNSTGCSPN